jgi:dipeptidyl aminopeptidase/acylaminoacyl peptidase
MEYGDPVLDRDFLTEISPINHVDRIRCPLLVAQGLNDPRVPPSESEQIVDELKRRGLPVEYVTADDEGHGFVKLRNRIRIYGAVVDFLNRYM